MVIIETEIIKEDPKEIVHEVVRDHIQVQGHRDQDHDHQERGPKADQGAKNVNHQTTSEVVHLQGPLHPNYQKNIEDAETMMNKDFA